MLDMAPPDDPLWYVHGRGDLPPVLEDALEGLGVQGHVSVEVPPGVLFKKGQTPNTVRLPISDFPKGVSPLVGMPCRVPELGTGWIQKVKDGWVWLSGDHPHAQDPLRWTATIWAVRDASPQELVGGPIEDTLEQRPR